MGQMIRMLPILLDSSHHLRFRVLAKMICCVNFSTLTSGPTVLISVVIISKDLLQIFSDNGMVCAVF
jgi:hypothetical protein